MCLLKKLDFFKVAKAQGNKDLRKFLLCIHEKIMRLVIYIMSLS
jgi:hypothetical protein